MKLKTDQQKYKREQVHESVIKANFEIKRIYCDLPEEFGGPHLIFRSLSVRENSLLSSFCCVVIDRRRFNKP